MSKRKPNVRLGKGYGFERRDLKEINERDRARCREIADQAKRDEEAADAAAGELLRRPEP